MLQASKRRTGPRPSRPAQGSPCHLTSEELLLPLLLLVSSRGLCCTNKLPRPAQRETPPTHRLLEPVPLSRVIRPLPRVRLRPSTHASSKQHAARSLRARASSPTAATADAPLLDTQTHHPGPRRSKPARPTCADPADFSHDAEACHTNHT